MHMFHFIPKIMTNTEIINLVDELLFLDAHEGQNPNRLQEIERILRDQGILDAAGTYTPLDSINSDLVDVLNEMFEDMI